MQSLPQVEQPPAGDRGAAACQQGPAPAVAQVQGLPPAVLCHAPAARRADQQAPEDCNQQRHR